MYYRTSKIIFVCLITMLLLSACDSIGGSDSITSEALAVRISAEQAPIILDVRSPDEFAAGHIPGAINIPDTELEANMSELVPYRGQEIIVHCQSGGRAAVASQTLTAAGFRQIVELEGHMAAWQAGGYPLD